MTDDTTPDDEPEETPELDLGFEGDSRPATEEDDWVEEERERGASIRDRLTGPFRRGWDAGYNLGSYFADGTRKVLQLSAGTVYGFGVSFTRIIPRSEKIWHGVAKRGIRGMYKAAGGRPDAIGIVHRENGQLDLTPIKWKRSAPDDPTQPNRWVTKSGEEWHPGAEGRETELMGTTPVILLDEDAEAVGSFLQSRFQAALDLGWKDKLFVPETVEQIIVEVDGQALSEGGPQAIADGGAVTNQRRYEIRDSDWENKLADVLVDIATPDSDSGMRVSAKAYKEVYQEKVGSEEMQMQELRGRAAEADPNAKKEMMFKVLKWVAIIALAWNAPDILSLLMGNGGAEAAQNLNPFVLVPF